MSTQDWSNIIESTWSLPVGIGDWDVRRASCPACPWLWNYSCDQSWVVDGRPPAGAGLTQPLNHAQQVGVPQWTMNRFLCMQRRRQRPGRTCSPCLVIVRGREGRERSNFSAWVAEDREVPDMVLDYPFSRMCFLFHRKILCSLHVGNGPLKYVLGFGIGKKKQIFINFFLCTSTFMHFILFHSPLHLVR